MDKNISEIIVSICKEQGIDYKSINPNYVAFCSDAKRLGQIISEIEGLIDELDNIINRHKISSNIKEQIEKDLKNLHLIDHNLITLAMQIKNE